MHARWASTSRRVRVFDELFVLAGGPSADLALESLEALVAMADPASRSALRSPPADPLAALLHLIDRRLSERGAGPAPLAALRLTPPWAAVALAGDVHAAHVSAGLTRMEGSLPALGRGGPLALRYVPLARGDRFVLATADIDSERATGPAPSIEERCRGLALRDDEDGDEDGDEDEDGAAIVIELL